MPIFFLLEAMLPATAIPTRRSINWRGRTWRTLPYPAYVIPGNQDVGNKHTRSNGPSDSRDDIALNMTSERLRLFASYFGPINWTFMHRGVRFTGFYAAVAGSGLPEEERFWRFMDRLANQPAALHHVAIMHYWLYIDAIDEKSWDITQESEYLPWYFGIDHSERLRIRDYLLAAGVEVLMCGHVHAGRPVETLDGIRIYKCSAGGNTAQMSERFGEVESRVGFHKCMVTDGGIDVAFVPGKNQTKEYGTYGPGGHPPISERDYSIAREEPHLSPDTWLIDGATNA